MPANRDGTRNCTRAKLIQKEANRALVMQRYTSLGTLLEVIVNFSFWKFTNSKTEMIYFDQQ